MACLVDQATPYRQAGSPSYWITQHSTGRNYHLPIGPSNIVNAGKITFLEDQATQYGQAGSPS